jgi:sulfite exporter TauE/SafE
LRGRIRGDSAGAVFSLGAVYGFAGFCSGPILGAVLTVAAASGGALRGALLLAVYAAGMAAPLFLMAVVWERFDLGDRRWLRGRGVALGPFSLHTTNLVSGVMFVALGVLYIAYEGTSALSGLYESGGATDLAFAAERWVSTVADGIPGIALLAAVAALPAAFVLRRWLRRGGSKHASGAGDA